MNEMVMVCHSLNNNTRTGLVISLCLNANLLVSLIPRMASNYISSSFGLRIIVQIEFRPAPGPERASSN